MMWCTLVSLFVQTIKSPTAAWIGFGSKALRPNVPTIRMITDIGVGGGTGVGGVVGSGIGAGVVGSSSGRTLPPPAPGAASGVSADGDEGRALPLQLQRIAAQATSRNDPMTLLRMTCG